MKIFNWNCRGLGNLRAERALQRLVTSKDPDVVFLMETRRKTGELKGIAEKIGMLNMVGVDCRGEGQARGGGLALFWKEEINLSLENFSSNHVHAKLIPVDGPDFHLTGFYGYPEEHNKHRSWQLLRRLKDVSERQWLCLGDFNAILSSSEKCGGLEVALEQIADFQSCLTDCELHDMGYSGCHYTWNNGRQGASNIQERLDRSVATQQLLDIWSASEVRHLLQMQSDHTPLLVHLAAHPIEHGRKKKRLFRLEQYVAEDPDFMYHLRGAWRDGGHSFDSKLNAARETISQLTEEKRSLRKEIGILEKKIEKA